MSSLRFAVLGLCFLFASGVSAIADLAEPDGSVILTIGGNISQTNRGPSNTFDDAFLSTHEYGFAEAASFDVTMLEQLGMVSVTLKAAPWPRAVVFEGPRLRDVMTATGWSGKAITAVALDGFAVDITAAELEAHDWILALKADGQYLGIGGRGPAWLVHDVPGGNASVEDEARWPWAVFYIQAD